MPDMPVDSLEPLTGDPEAPEHPKHPINPKEVNPKIASDIAYWSKEFNVSGPLLHEAIRTHGTHVDKLRAALAHHGVNLT